MKNRPSCRWISACRAPDSSGLFLALVLQVISELPSPGRVAELGERLRLDLADPLTGDAELPPHLLERPRPPVRQAEPELEDPPLPGRQRPEDRDDLFLHHPEGSGLERGDGPVVLDELSERSLILADGGLEGERFPGCGADLFDPFRRQAGEPPELLGRGLPAEGLRELSLSPAHFVEGLGHVDRDPDDPGLIGDTPTDRLADPPRG